MGWGLGYPKMRVFGLTESHSLCLLKVSNKNESLVTLKGEKQGLGEAFSSGLLQEEDQEVLVLLFAFWI